MESWYHKEDTMILESFGASFCSTSSDDFPGMTYLSDTGCSDAMEFSAPHTQSHCYNEMSAVSQSRSAYIDFRRTNASNVSLQMENRNPFSRQFNQQQQKLQQMDFPPTESSQPSSTSLSSLKSLSMGSQELTSLLNSSTTSTTSVVQKPPAQCWNTESDEAAIMRAMVAVISSSTSPSSNVSSPSVMSRSPARVSCRSPAFMPYSSSKMSSPIGELLGQKMFKRSISMLKSIKAVKAEGEEGEETRVASNQLHHMISERRRREKLNESFHSLRMLLPPASKKDKTSVLNNARNYLKTLKSQISDLQEKNRQLETHLSVEETVEPNLSTRNITVKIIRTSEPTAEIQQVNLRVTIRVECDIVELVLHLLECLKALEVINVASVDAYTYSTQMPLYARASLKLQIKTSDWNEATLQEAMTMAIDVIQQ